MGIIITSAVIADDIQKDGRRYIRERHTTDTGEVHTANYLGDAGVDADAVMLARVPEIEAQIAEVAANEVRTLNADSALSKTEAYIAGLSDADAQRLIGYTDDELVLVREVAR